MNHAVTWQTPQPLWSRFGETQAEAALSADQARPAILRFASDDFMEQVLATLAQDPASLGDRVARPESWRLPMDDAASLVEQVPLPRIARALARNRKDQSPRTTLKAGVAQAPVVENSVARTLPLKLYHPAHQRHYLVAANLVCAQPGLPDRALSTGGSEQVGFVLRRLLPPVPAIAGTDRVEFAFVKDDGGARWQRVLAPGQAGSETALVKGEELLSLFPLNFTADNGQPRRLHAGVVPVGRREEYMSTRAQHTPTAAGSPGGVAGNDTPVTARKEQFKADVSEPWKNLVRSAVAAKTSVMDLGNDTTDADELTDQANQRTSKAQQANRQLQGQSWLVLLDFADYLATHLPKVWDAVVTPSLGASLTGTAKTLYDWLDSGATTMGTSWPGLSDTAAITLRDALERVRTDTVRAGLEGMTSLFPDVSTGFAWPSFTYLLAGVRGSGVNYSVDGLHVSLATKSVTPDSKDVDASAPSLTPMQIEAEAAARSVDKLVQMVVTAIDTTQPSQPTPPVPFAARLRDAFATTQGDEGWFVMRCVYVRCDCGPIKPAVLSPPSSRFQLASFFDSDAPHAPIRIALPLDTTPAGLRKHNKNTAFVISDVLCGQIQRAKGLGLIDLVLSVLPWPLHKDLDMGGMGPCKQSPQLSLGMICSLSIPIITICALILLMIIISLLDFVFRWLPYFLICFPVPKLKGKGDT